MLKLTDSELDIVLAAARPLAVEERDGFLKEVAERLAALPERGEGLVYQVCREIQRKYWDPPIDTENRAARPLYKIRADAG
jgi:hypothetical protein